MAGVQSGCLAVGILQRKENCGSAPGFSVCIFSISKMSSLVLSQNSLTEFKNDQQVVLSLNSNSASQAQEVQDAAYWMGPHSLCSALLSAHFCF